MSGDPRVAWERLRNNPKRRALAERAQGYVSPGAAYVLRDAAATVGATAERERRDLSRSERKAIKLLLDLAARYDGTDSGEGGGRLSAEGALKRVTAPSPPGTRNLQASSRPRRDGHAREALLLMAIVYWGVPWSEHRYIAPKWRSARIDGDPGE